MTRGRRPLLALSGKRFSGKDTLAALLQERAAGRGIALHTFAFAAESKRLFALRARERGEAVDFERLLHDRAYKEQMRPELTRFTMESLSADPLVFCRSVAARVEEAEGLCVITDVRLRVEVAALRERFDLRLVRVLRSDAERARSGWAYSAEKDEHSTETELDDASLWDEALENNGSLDALSERAASILMAYAP